MVGNVVSFLLIGLYLGTLLAVAVYGIHRYVLLYLYLKHRKNAATPKGTFAQLPRVTVQLPMFNEDVVAERIIDAACQLDYPRELLEIQVLDDSTDDSAAIAEAACQKWSAQGYDVQYIHRTNRSGYKAGALEAGLATAKGDYVAIFDADFVPPPDMLRNTVPFFTDPKVGMVQVRWDHLNRNASLLTRSQAIFLDGHFVIEHTARNRSGRFMHFNGTAGVWRKDTIRDAGGWQHDTLTEDLDLSYRAQMKGWQFVYLPQYAAPAELPPEMCAFKAQAHRWTKGSVQTCMKLLPSVLRSHVSRRIKSEAFFHLTNTFVYPLMVLLTLLMYPTFFTYYSPFKAHSAQQHLFSFSLFILATCSAGTFFIYAQKELFGKQAGWKTMISLPFLMAIGVGVSINNTRAVIEAIWSSLRKKESEFVRTPKYGVVGTARNTQWRRDSLFTWKRLWQPLLEIAFGVYTSYCLYIAVDMFIRYTEDVGISGLAGIPFLMIFAGGYFYVGFGTLYALWKMQQQKQQAAAAATVPVEA
jgi:cellulose synthase/poly-beta-1,6-N-acetylglucosamine synthase-like glycosyltransferase